MSERKETLLWPRPRELALPGGSLPLDAPLALRCDTGPDWLPAAARLAAQSLNRLSGRRLVSTRRTAGPELHIEAAPRRRGRATAESYTLHITRRAIRLAAAEARGVQHGAHTLAQLAETRAWRSVPCARISDGPRFPLRGAHVFLPARNQLAFFERFLDFLAALKFNTLLLEIGGGMEYERHPEINAAWERFCAEADGYEPLNDPGCERFKQRHPRGANALSNSRHYWKDSTHTELAGGTWLRKDEVRRIVRACAERHIEIIPEVQSFSHSYYLCCAHPEIAERSDDPWPDTYCPSNPKTYEILFDVMDEVIEVFRPRILHIGHDELYHIGLCPRCRRRTGHDLLTSDLRKIHAFLAGRGVRPLMWGDKLMNFTTPDGTPQGGARREFADPGTGKTWAIEATYEAADRVPKDLLICDWYWGLDPNSERNFHKHGFEVVYGNFSPWGFRNWERRARRRCVLGAEVSSWCEVSAYAFGHNRVFHDLFAAADMLWSGSQRDPAEVAAEMARRLPARLDRLTGGRRWLVSPTGGRAQPVDLKGAVTPLAEALPGRIKAPAQVAPVTGVGRFDLITDARGFLSRAIVLGKSNPVSAPVRVRRKAERLLVLHGTTMQDLFFQPTYYSYHRGPAEVLRFVVTYADGRRARFSAYFGDDIGPILGAWPVRRGGICFRSIPVTLGDCTLYAQEWRNPRPEVRIDRIVVHVGRDASEVGEAVVAAISTVR